MAGLSDPRPSIDRPSVSRVAVALAGPLARGCDLTGYRLAGGTALAWAFGHRVSDDLDFFTRPPHRFDSAEQRRIESALRDLDADASVDVSQPATLHGVVRGCRVSVFGLGGRWLDPPIATAEGLWVATPAEVAAMKLVAVATRSARKDFLDLHALYTRGFGAERMFSALRRMYPDEVDLDAGTHVVRALTDFSDAELDPDPIVLDSTTWDDAKRSAARMAADLSLHLADLRNRGLLR